MQTVHLPHIPGDHRDELPIFGEGRLPPPALPQVFLKGHQQIDTGNQKVVPLELIAIGGMKCPESPFQPIFLCLGVFVHCPQFPVQQADAVGNRDNLAGFHIIPAHQEGGLPASDLQHAGVHILLPAGFAVPHLIGVAAHLPAHPQGRGDFSMLPCPAGLLLHLLPGAGLDDRGVGTGN